MPWEEECDVDIAFRVECSDVPYSLHVDQLWVSVLITIYCKKKEKEEEEEEEEKEESSLSKKSGKLLSVVW